MPKFRKKPLVDPLYRSELLYLLNSYPWTSTEDQIRAAYLSGYIEVHSRIVPRKPTSYHEIFVRLCARGRYLQQPNIENMTGNDNG